MYDFNTALGGGGGGGGGRENVSLWQATAVLY